MICVVCSAKVGLQEVHPSPSGSPLALRLSSCQPWALGTFLRLTPNKKNMHASPPLDVVLTPGVLQSLQRRQKDLHASVTALRKFLRKGVETVLVSGRFLQQTEEALGPAKPAPTPMSTGRLPTHGPQAAQSYSGPGGRM